MRPKHTIVLLRAFPIKHTLPKRAAVSIDVQQAILRKFGYLETEYLFHMEGDEEN